MHILVTGFGPFLGHEINPAGELAKALKGEGITTEVFTVSYDVILQDVPAAIKKAKPDFILSFGLASSREYISLEQYGYNEMNCTHPDVAGATKLGEPILKGSPKQLATPLNLHALKEALAKQGITSEISTDSGRYICNETYFLDLASGIPSLFVHLPGFENSSFENDQKAAGIILEEIKRHHR
jgi:pyroglutamyl-peptidase